MNSEELEEAAHKARIWHEHLSRWAKDVKAEGGSLDIDIGGTTLGEALEKAKEKMKACKQSMGR